MPLRQRQNSMMPRRRRLPAQPTVGQMAANDATNFCELTTAHGIPRIGAATSWEARALWTVLYISCFVAFLYQAYLIVSKFLRYEKMVNVQLKFEQIAFPAVTICNLNPYKKSLASGVGGLASMFQAFEEQLDVTNEPSTDERGRRGLLHNSLTPRPDDTGSGPTSDGGDSFRLVAAACECLHSKSAVCTYVPPDYADFGPDECICVWNTHLDVYWPCYDKSTWHNVTCASCIVGTGTCDYPKKEGTVNAELTGTSCTCQPDLNLCYLSEINSADAESAILETLEQLDLPESKWLVQPVLSGCHCTQNAAHGCFADPTVIPKSDAATCLCVRDTATTKLWPCAPRQSWQLHSCGQCSSHGYCAFPMQGLQPNNGITCLCHGPSFFCIAVEIGDARADFLASLPRTWLIGKVDERRETSRTKREVPLSDLRARALAKRQHLGALQPAYTACKCTNRNSADMDCRPQLHKRPNVTDPLCLCFYNSMADNVWPCYPTEFWFQRKCVGCSGMGQCDYVTDAASSGGEIPCLCVDRIKLCVRLEVDLSAELYPEEAADLDSNETAILAGAVDGSGESEEVDDGLPILKIWERTTQPPPPTTTTDSKVKDAMGFEGMTDSVAIVAQANENMIFEVAQMNASEKAGLSYTKEELIKKCSFNGRQCSVANDFELHLDSRYGNCYTFNYDPVNPLTADKAGPNYGLRVQLHVNLSEYLRTAEASGVRIAVHPQGEQPFPETIGYSAPTGFQSSFGIRMTKVTRLPSPFGDCVLDGKNDDFIYRDKTYSTEGCTKSCIQRYLVDTCGCGDPRFPVYRDAYNCPSDDPQLRECLEAGNTYALRNSKELDCICRQPCEQIVYSTSYSAAKWPSNVDQVKECPDGMTLLECLLYYREEGVMVEIFYEELNYEYLNESPAYGIANLLADFGGQMGLWLGVSIITLTEVLVFFGQLLTVCCRSKRYAKLRRKSVAAAAAASTSDMGASSVVFDPKDDQLNGSPRAQFLAVPSLRFE